MQKEFKAWRALGWATVFLLVLTLVVFGLIRTYDTWFDTSGNGLFESRYVDNPIVTALHMITGIGFVLLAPLQFVTRIRNRHRKFHRVLGRVLLLAALVAGIYGLIALVRFPAYGGLATESAGWFFGPLFLLSLYKAFSSIRRRDIPAHREWMIRAYALGLGVGTQRLTIGVLLAFSNNEFVDIFGPALWIGFSLNVVAAEWWIAKTRPPARPLRAAATS